MPHATGLARTGASRLYALIALIAGLRPRHAYGIFSLLEIRPSPSAVAAHVHRLNSLYIMKLYTIFGRHHCIALAGRFDRVFRFVCEMGPRER